MDYLYSPYPDSWSNGHASLSESSSKEKEFKTSNKTEEEMKRLTMDEALSELQKASYILSKGQSFQKFAIYTQLPSLFREPDGQGKFLQQVFDDIPSNDEELQIEAAKSFAKAIKEKILDQNSLQKVFAITLNILKIWSQPILLAWVEVFRELLNVMSYPSIEKDCYAIITILSDHSQPKTSRYIAGILIGLVSEKLREAFTSPLMERVRALCQDPDIEIRKMMANEVLERICFSIGSEKTEIYILEKIMELVYDGEINVKCAGIRLVFRIIDALHPEIKANRITTLFIELLASINEEVLKVISSQIGLIVYKLEAPLKKNTSYLASILSTFKEYGTNKLDEIRKNFCFNLPAILSVIDPKQFDLFKNIYLAQLLTEKSLDIRLTAVACLHEILKLVGFEECHKSFKDILKALFKESSFLILKKLIEHLNEILEAFYGEEVLTNEEYITNYQEILGYIINLGCRFHKENQWRLQEKLLKELQKDLRFFKMGELNEKYWPFLQNILKNGVFEIRTCACLSVVKFLKVNYYEKKRLEIVKHVNEHFFKSKSYFLRMVYLDFVALSCAYFSQAFLRMHIIPDCFKLANDRVPNVRRKLLLIMPQIRKRIENSDADNLAKFDETLLIFKKDFDLDVSDTLNKVSHTLANLQFEDEEFLKELQFFEDERQAEEEDLRLIELKETEEAKRKDSNDLDLFYPSNYYSSILGKSNKNKAKVPGSAGLGNYRFAAAKNLASTPNVVTGPGLSNSMKLKSTKDISSFSPLSKPTSNTANSITFSPQPHKSSLIMQNSEKNALSVKKIEEKKKEKEGREIYSASKTTKPPVLDPKMTKFAALDKEKDKKIGLLAKKDPKKI